MGTDVESEGRKKSGRNLGDGAESGPVVSGIGQARSRAGRAERR
jgi:hypothetical protein